MGEHNLCLSNGRSVQRRSQPIPGPLALSSPLGMHYGRVSSTLIRLLQGKGKKTKDSLMLVRRLLDFQRALSDFPISLTGTQPQSNGVSTPIVNLSITHFLERVTVAGRTSAYVQQVQKLRKVAAKQATDEEEADLTPLSDEETIEKGSRKRKASQGA